MAAEAVPCDGCEGTGRRWNSRYASRKGVCRDCRGTGEVVRDPAEQGGAR